MSFPVLILFSTLVGYPTFEDARVPDFDTTVLPVLTKAGCNAASCHGSAAGRGGFHLSLYGSDPAGDYLAIARERAGRRGQSVRSCEQSAAEKTFRFDEARRGTETQTEFLGNENSATVDFSRGKTNQRPKTCRSRNSTVTNNCSRFGKNDRSESLRKVRRQFSKRSHRVGDYRRGK